MSEDPGFNYVRFINGFVRITSNDDHGSGAFVWLVSDVAPRLLMGGQAFVLETKSVTRERLSAMVEFLLAERDVDELTRRYLSKVFPISVRLPRWPVHFIVDENPDGYLVTMHREPDAVERE